MHQTKMTATFCLWSVTCLWLFLLSDAAGEKQVYLYWDKKSAEAQFKDKSYHKGKQRQDTTKELHILQDSLL